MGKHIFCISPRYSLSGVVIFHPISRVYLNTSIVGLLDVNKTFPYCLHMLYFYFCITILKHYSTPTFMHHANKILECVNPCKGWGHRGYAHRILFLKIFKKRNMPTYPTYYFWARYGLICPSKENQGSIKASENLWTPLTLVFYEFISPLTCLSDQYGHLKRKLVFDKTADTK